MELLVMDFDGTRMQVSIKSWLIPYFDRLIKLGDWVWAEKFKVSDSPKKFPMASHPFRIVLQFETALGSILDCSFPVSVYNFKSFTEIKETSYCESDPLFDVIGRVVSVDNVMENGNPEKLTVDVTLEDLELNRIHCLLGAPYLSEFLTFRERVNEDINLCCIIVQLCKKTMLASGEVGVTNTVCATKLVLDQDDCVIDAFRNKIQVDEDCSSCEERFRENESPTSHCGKRKLSDL